MRFRVLVIGLTFLLTLAIVGPTPFSISPASAGPAAQGGPGVGALTFSSGMTSQFLPDNAAIEFDSDNDGVYVTFEYFNMPAGATLSRIVRFEGEDYNFGDLDCCSQGNGRSGFRVVKRDGKEGQIPGGAYDVRIYLGGTELQHGGFGVKGTEGGDHDNENSNGNN
ncbi:MAG: hypothetical protein IT307_05525 [Chloroflexi bacterium]|nr:hypothetical protein [Chloroflexota bacterium]